MLASLEDAKVLAGGQSLVPLLNFRLARPAHLVDINRIPNLNRIYEQDGAAAAHAMLAAHMSTGEAEVVAQVIGEQASRIGGGRVDRAVDSHAANSLSVTTWTRCSRNSGVASRSPLGFSPLVGFLGSASTGVGATPKRASRSP